MRKLRINWHKPFEFYIDPKQHCLNRSWNCWFLFWLKHGDDWSIRAVRKSLKEITENGDVDNV